MPTDLASEALPPAALSPRDAAKRIGVSVPTLYRVVRRGDLRLLKIGSRSLIRVSDLDALLERDILSTSA